MENDTKDNCEYFDNGKARIRKLAGGQFMPEVRRKFLFWSRWVAVSPAGFLWSLGDDNYGLCVVRTREAALQHLSRIGI